MKIAIASGKGGTGKTLMATNLARVLADQGDTVQYLDCDVEEPNGHIFLKPNVRDRRPVTVDVPEVDSEKCTGCGRCGQLCQYSAIVCLVHSVLTFEPLCHSCGGCSLVCPANAITAVDKVIGEIQQGSSGTLSFAQGQLNIGDVRSPAVIKAVKNLARNDATVIIDSPPGTTCPVVETLSGVDRVLLVTEPTPFGLHDLTLAVAMVRKMELPFAVVINRHDLSDDRVRRYCEKESVEDLLGLPNDRRIAETYARGDMVVDVLDEYVEVFTNIIKSIRAA